MFIYIDDVLIASKNIEEHIKHSRMFVKKEGLVLSEKKKQSLPKKMIEFLRIEIDESEIIKQDYLVEKFQNFPNELKEKKQLQSLGVVNFDEMFIKNLTKHRKVFSPLLKKDAKFI